MKINTYITIPAFLWGYGMKPAETMFLAFLLNAKLAHLRGENTFVVHDYSHTEISQYTPIEIKTGMFYRYRKELIRKRLLIPCVDDNKNMTFRFNAELWKKFRQTEFKFPTDLDNLNA